MPHLLLVIRSLIVASLRTDHELVLENMALRQQLAVYKARYPRPAVADADRLFWIALSRWWPRWRDALTIVSPETVIKWHRRGFRAFWRRKSKRGAPPSIPVQIREAIQRLHSENETWGAPRIHGELRRLDFDVREATVSRNADVLRMRRDSRWNTIRDRADGLPKPAASDRDDRTSRITRALSGRKARGLQRIPLDLRVHKHE